jgi:hypothetical protein
MATRNVSITLGNEDGPAANLTNLSVSFFDEAKPHLTTVARYQSATESTDVNGTLTFSFDSTLDVGGHGLLTIQGNDGVHYNGTWPVT